MYLGSALIFVPEYPAKSNAWLVGIIASFIGIYLIFVMKKVYYWYILAVIFLVIRSIIVLSMLNFDYIDLLRYPFYEAYRAVIFEGIERIELLFFFLWFNTGFFAVAVSYQAFVFGIKELININNERTLILPIALLIIVMTTIMFPNDIMYLNFEELAVNFHSLPIYILYPTIILIAAKIRMRSRKFRNANMGGNL